MAPSPPDPSQPPGTIVPGHVRRRHERAADGYDARAVLADRTREELLERLDLVALSPACILDAGAGTGSGTLALARRYPRARVIAVDHAGAMCRRVRRRRRWWGRLDTLQGELQALPIASGRIDLVFSNLALQDCPSLDGALAELRRVLSDEGLFTFATLGPDTLRELRQAWREVDALEHVHPFVDMHDLGEALLRNGFADPVLDVERYRLTYPDWTALITELRAVGGASAVTGRRVGLTGRRRLGALSDAYERFRDQGVLPVTCEVVFGHAWPARRAASTQNRDGSVLIPTQNIGRTPRRGGR
jgi:malonyl-CoA O-methyltransferase